MSHICEKIGNMEQYQEVSTKENGETEKSNGIKRQDRNKYAKIFPPYFPQVIAVITGKNKIGK